MVDNFSTVNSIKLFEFGRNSYWFGVVYEKQWERYYLDITRKFNQNKNGQAIKSIATTYLNLTAAAELVKQLPGVYQFAKNFQENQSVEIYR